METGKTEHIVRFREFEVDLRTGELRKGGEKVRIQEQPFRVLARLLETPGEIVSREELQKTVWKTGSFGDFDTGLNKAITKVREALEDSADAPRCIETMPRRGYRFIAPVQSGEEEEDGVTVPAPPAEYVTMLRRSLPTVLFIGGLAVVAAGAGIWWTGAFRRPQFRSIAVLPLQNLTGDPAQEYFADGMTDELITDLAQIHSLRVISRTSVMQFKGTKKTLPEIARELSVDAVIEGSVLKAADTVRVTAQLLDAHQDRHLWAESYERRMVDVVAMQRQVAQAIADQVRAKLTPAEHASLARARPSNPEAYEAMLKGRFYAYKRNGAAIRKAIGHFQEAVHLDPSDARAWAGLGGCYASLGGDLGVASPEAVSPLARAAIAKAMALEPDLAEAHANSGWVKLWFDWDWAGAEAEFRHAIDLNPNDSVAHRYYAHLLSESRRFDEALAENQRAIKADPLDTLANIHLAWIYVDMRQAEKAVEQCRRVIEMDSGFVGSWLWLARAYEQEKKWPEAIAAYERTKDLYGASNQAGMARVQAAMGNRQAAEETLARLRDASKRDGAYVSPVVFATVYAALGERRAALDELDLAYAQRATGLISINVGSAFDSLKNEARFKELVRHVGPSKSQEFTNER